MSNYGVSSGRGIPARIPDRAYAAVGDGVQGPDNATFVVIGDGNGGEIEVGLDRDSSMAALAKFKIDGKIVRAKFEEYLRGVIELRCEDVGIERIVGAQIERRVEVAAKAACAKIDMQATTIATEMVRAKILEIVKSMDLEVVVRGGCPAESGA